MTADPDVLREQAMQWHRAAWFKAEAFRTAVTTLVQDALRQQSIEVHSVDGRVKSEQSWVDKCLRRRPDGGVKYDRPVEQIDDLVGLRIITYLLDSLPRVQALLETLFEVDGPVERAVDLTRPGYSSVHYVVSMTPAQLALPGNALFHDMRVEIQVRTVLQHAWAEIQHDYLYKGTTPPPPDLQRRLTALAGLLDLADQEFRRILLELQSTAEAEEVAALVEDDTAAAGVALTVPVLRSYCEELLGGAERLAPEYFVRLHDVLTALGVPDLASLQEVLGRARTTPERVRELLRREGYAPGPVEVLDGLVRCALGEAYLDRRPELGALPVERQQAARQHLRRFVDAAQHEQQP